MILPTTILPRRLTDADSQGQLLDHRFTVGEIAARSVQGLLLVVLVRHAEMVVTVETSSEGNQALVVDTLGVVKGLPPFGHTMVLPVRLILEHNDSVQHLNILSMGRRLFQAAS
jgi:hypothetical protein